MTADRAPGPARGGGRKGAPHSLLRATFVHLPGIGATTEIELWRRGIRDWSGLRTAALDRKPPGLLPALDASETALVAQDPAWFGRRLPPGELWRLYPEFREKTAFLDIETTSLSPYEGMVTVVSVHARGATRSFVAGEDLEELPAYLRGFPVLVTFNGSRFDVPFLEVSLPGFLPPPVHLDLRFLLYRLGVSGGLKRIESTLGIGDRQGVEGIGGLEAVRLWHEHRQGTPGALERLVRYNRADTRNLEPLLEYAVGGLSERLLGPSAARWLSGPGG
jgi:uncharacterized protein